MALNPIVKKNLKLMRSRQSGGMAGMSESIGGNAGSNNSAHNFYYNKGNGEIVYFGNIQASNANVICGFPYWLNTRPAKLL